MDAFVASGYAAFALDARGYGDTPRDATGWLDPDRAAADAAIALDWVTRRSMALGITSRPALFGYSRGAAVALLCAQRHADKLGALLLFGFTVDLDKGFPQAVDPEFPPRTANTAADAASDFITPSAISKAAIDAYISAAVASDPVRVDWRRMELFNSLDPALVKVPTLILQGSADPAATSDKQAKLLGRLGCADRTWVVIPGSDHAAHVEDSQERLVQAVVSFLERPRRTWSSDCTY